MVKLESLKKASSSKKHLKEKAHSDYFSIFAAKIFINQKIKIIY